MGAWLQGGLRPRPASSHLRLLSVNWGEGSLLPCPLALVGGLRPPRVTLRRARGGAERARRRPASLSEGGMAAGGR